MLLFNTNLLADNLHIIQKITIENCTASINLINDILKRFPFNAYVVQNTDKKLVKKTIIYVHLKDNVRFDSIETIQNVILEVITHCQQTSELLEEQSAIINALIKDCKPFKDEKPESDSSTTEKISDC